MSGAAFVLSDIHQSILDDTRKRLQSTVDACMDQLQRDMQFAQRIINTREPEEEEEEEEEELFSMESSSSSDEFDVPVRYSQRLRKRPLPLESDEQSDNIIDLNDDDDGCGLSSVDLIYFKKWLEYVKTSDNILQDLQSQSWFKNHQWYDKLMVVANGQGRPETSTVFEYIKTICTMLRGVVTLSSFYFAVPRPTWITLNKAERHVCIICGDKKLCTTRIHFHGKPGFDTIYHVGSTCYPVADALYNFLENLYKFDEDCDDMCTAYETLNGLMDDIVEAHAGKNKRRK